LRGFRKGEGSPAELQNHSLYRCSGFDAIVCPAKSGVAGSAMTIEGGCYCGAVRYRSEGEAFLKAECFCRECQYITGGASVLIMAVPAEGFSFTKGETRPYARTDIKNAVTREFCSVCGTHILTRAPALPHGVIIKVGSLDDPAQFGGPDTANFACDAQPYHRLPTDIPVYQKWGR
jgi:hypothetical protein